jgi:hypothetical protein
LLRAAAALRRSDLDGFREASSTTCFPIQIAIHVFSDFFPAFVQSGQCR